MLLRYDRECRSLCLTLLMGLLVFLQLPNNATFILTLPYCSINIDLQESIRPLARMQDGYVGSARHNPSNSGIERFNRTIQDKVKPTYKVFI